MLSIVLLVTQPGSNVFHYCALRPAVSVQLQAANLVDDGYMSKLQAGF